MIKAKYTVVLKNLMDDPAIKPMIEQAMSTYPLYEKRSPEEYIYSMVPSRKELNDSILRYYKYREIGFETIGRFLDELETALLEIMPYYNQLFMTTDLDYNPIYNVDYKKTITTDREGSSAGKTRSEDDITLDRSNHSTVDRSNNSTVDRSNNSTVDRTNETKGHNTNVVTDLGKNVVSSTPQGNINVPADNIENVAYADSVEWKKNNTNSRTDTESNDTAKDITVETGKDTTVETAKDTTVESGQDTTRGINQFSSEGNTTNKEETLETTKGNFGVVSAQDLVQKYRDIIINIKQELINDPRINELFMQVY